jgi:hypothetical protein
MNRNTAGGGCVTALFGSYSRYTARTSRIGSCVTDMGGSVKRCLHGADVRIRANIKRRARCRALCGHAGTRAGEGVAR